MYAQSFLVTSVRGIGLLPTTSDRAALGVIGFMNAALGFLADFFAVFLAISTPSMCRDPPDETARECPQRSTSARIFMGKMRFLHRENGRCYCEQVPARGGSAGDTLATCRYC